MNNDYLTDCCDVEFIEPNYPDTDICSSCYEHSGLSEDKE